MSEFILWSVIYAAASVVFVRLYCLIREPVTAFEPEQIQETSGQVRVLRAHRPRHIDLTETDLRK